MEAASHLILLVSGLVLVALAAASAGARVGAPLLLVFLAVGLLAGPEGPGGIAIVDVDFAYAGASAALAIILLDGASRTRPETLALGFKPGMALASLGVLITAVVTGIAAMVALGVGWREALLLGAIVSATDAAAVFSLLGERGAKVQERLAATLETESGINDPAAVFLTMALATALTTPDGLGVFSLLGWLSWQAFAGAVLGLAAGEAIAFIKPRTPLAPGLKPILTLAGGLFVFALAQSFGASGFLAVYLAGLVQARASKGVAEAEARTLDGYAWLAQISLFLTLGLMATPSLLITVIGPAVAISLALMFIARPLAAWACLAPFGFTRREQAFAAWTGLRGATPIFLGLTPVALGVPNASLFFSIAVIVAVVSLVAQGWTVPAAARLLGVTEDGAASAVRLGPVRVFAGAISLLVAISAATWIARSTSPVVEPDWTPITVAGLSERLSREPAAIATALPDDWMTGQEMEERRRLFTATLAPIVDAENARLLAERAELEAMAQSLAEGRVLSWSQQNRIAALSLEYGVADANPSTMLVLVDAVPTPLVIAHAAYTTGWGSSDAARFSNALFGRRPGGEGETAYVDLAASVEDYINALNTHGAFDQFRRMRSVARAGDRLLNAEELAAGLAPFAEDGDAFVAALRSILQHPPVAELTLYGPPQSRTPQR